MKEIKNEILKVLQKIHSENKMPKTIKIKLSDMIDNSAIHFDITMTPEECKDWSYIFTGDEQIEYPEFSKDFDYNEELGILHLVYKYPNVSIIHNDEWS